MKEEFMINRDLRILFLVLIASVSLFANLEALIFLNGVGGGGGDGELGYNHEVGPLSMEAATLFLNSNADTYLLLGEVEKYYNSYFDFSSALVYSGSAAQKLADAESIYVEIKHAIKRGGVLPEMVAKLATFDYLGFAEANDLNREVMLEVSYYLASGDIAGLVSRNIDNLRHIQKLYSKINLNLRQFTLPPIHSFWSLLNQYSQATLFGNYAALVFHNI
jgi:hypothetical protein